jgi:Putative MetA-pathway of phenol degradation
MLVASGMPAKAEDLQNFATRILQWPKPEPEPEPDDERETDTEAEEDEEPIETDRNSFTFATVTPGPGRLIVESAYSYINIGQEGAKHSFPETVFRYGIGDRLELRLGYNYEIGRASNVAEGDIASNFGINAEQQILYGFKYALTRQRPESRFMPNSAFLAQGNTPIGSVEGQTQIRLGYALGWVLPNGWTFDQGLRFGTDREGRDAYTLWAPSAVLRIPLGREKRWFTHVEYFGIVSQAKEHDFSKQFIDTGLHYFITPNFEVGTVVAFGLNEQTRGVLVNVGFGLRF